LVSKVFQGLLIGSRYPLSLLEKFEIRNHVTL
jgi:hypothetical protein